MTLIYLIIIKRKNFNDTLLHYFLLGILILGLKLNLNVLNDLLNCFIIQSIFLILN